MKRLSDRKKLSDIVHERIDEAGGPEVVAAELNKTYSTLMAEVNGLYNDESHNKLGVRTLGRIMDLSDPEPVLRWFNETYGFLGPLRPPQAMPTGESLHQSLTRITSQLGRLADRVNAAKDPGGPGGAAVLHAEMQDIEREADELARQLAQLVANGRMEAVDPHPAGRRKG